MPDFMAARALEDGEFAVFVVLNRQPAFSSTHKQDPIQHEAWDRTTSASSMRGWTCRAGQDRQRHARLPQQVRPAGRLGDAVRYRDWPPDLSGDLSHWA